MKGIGERKTVSRIKFTMYCDIIYISIYAMDLIILTTSALKLGNRICDAKRWESKQAYRKLG